MAEIVLATGSARPVYTTLALADGALPPTSADTYAIELWNDSEFVLTAERTIGNGASGYAIVVRPTAGHGFRDHANRLTNPLKYNQANGVGISTVTADIRLLTTTNSNVTFDGLQLKVDQSDLYNNGIALRMQGAVAKNCLIDIVAGANSGGVSLINNGGSDGAALYNSVVIRRAGPQGVVALSGINNEVRNCTLVKTSDGTSGGAAIYSENGASTNILKNTAVFGPWANMIAEGTPGSEFSAANSGYNATSAASGLPGSTGNVYSLTYANQFENVTTAAYDFRAKSGNGLQVGTRDQTYTADLDIVNSARSITTPTIGAWEYSVASTPFTGTGNITNLRVRASAAAGAFGTVYRITGTLVDPTTGAPRASLTNLDAAFFDQATPSALLAPTNVISNLTTDGSGVFSWLMPLSALTAGQTGLFLLYHAGLGYLGAYRIVVTA